jgi:hypothetical protein
MTNTVKKTYIKTIGDKVVKRTVAFDFESALSILKPAGNEQVFLLVEHKSFTKENRGVSNKVLVKSKKEKK